MEQPKTYEDGLQDGVKLWCSHCSKQPDCEHCALATIIGDTGISCTEYAQKFPQKTVTLLKDFENQPRTYYDEYRARFPHMDIPLEYFAELMCRKACFEGYVECTGEKSCVDCWKEHYYGDVTGEENENSWEENFKED